MRYDPVRQIAYFVDDVRQAAAAHSRMFGSGPFFVIEHIPLLSCRYRGVPCELDHGAAWGQWGEVMVEFVQQNNPGPSLFREIRAGGRGIHHVALIVDDLAASMRDFEVAGYAEALFAESQPGVCFAMMDTVADYGHFTELYEPTAPMLAIYETVRNAAVGYDGSEIFREFG